MKCNCEQVKPGPSVRAADSWVTFREGDGAYNASGSTKLSFAYLNAILSKPICSQCRFLFFYETNPLAMQEVTT